jgi:transposase
MDGPGEYVTDVTQGVTRVEDLPPPRVERRSRNFARRRCPRCGAPGAGRRRTRDRVLHDVGDPRTGRPVDLRVTYSQHRCPRCRAHFAADTLDLALPGCHYTHRVVALAVRLAVEDGLGYRAASWHLWRDHRVFVPWATVQNWVEGAGEKR